MDDITVYGESLNECLIYLETVLHRCIEKNLVLNWEKMPFYGKSGHSVRAHHFRKGN